MKAITPLLGLWLLWFFVGPAQAQLYDFEDVLTGSILSNENSWTSNDLNQSDGVEDFQGSFFPGTAGSNVGIIGGFWEDSGSLITPSNRINLLTASVTATPSTAYPFLRFRWIQNISNTDQDNGKRDTFGWTVQSGSTSLLSLVSTPDGPTSNFMTVKGYVGATSGNLLGGMFTPNISTLARGSAYAFEVEINPNAWTWSAKVSGSFSADYESIADWSTIIQNAALGGTHGSVIDGFAATWITQDANPANAGRNVMAFDNLNIVPEPSTFSLLALGSLTWLAARRRSS